MKKGKTIRIHGFKTIKALYGTVDSKNLKSIYLNIQTWVDPKIDIEDGWSRIISNLSRQIKQTIFENLNKNLFDNNFIVDLDLRSSGIQYGKKSFMNLEITFFLKDPINFKSSNLKSEIKKIIQFIFFDNLKDNKYFYFNISKKPAMSLSQFDND